MHQEKTTGEDNALLILRFASGGIGHCEVSWTTKGGLDLRNEIHGSEGSIFTDVTRSTPIASFSTKSAGYVIEKADIDFGWTRPLPEEAFVYGYQAEMRHFIECVSHGTPARETYEDGYIVNCISTPVMNPCDPVNGLTWCTERRWAGAWVKKGTPMFNTLPASIGTRRLVHLPVQPTRVMNVITAERTSKAATEKTS